MEGLTVKRFVNVIISLIIILTLLSGCHQQETGGQNNKSEYQYEIVANQVRIISHIDKESTNVTIPEEIDGMPVTTLLKDAFYQHKEMVSVVLPQSLVEIHGSPFYRCYALKQINIPKNVKNIDSNPFFRCSSLREITVDNENEKFLSIDGVLFDKGVNMLVSYPEGKEDETYIIPSTVTKLNIDSFGYHPKFKKLVVLSNVIEFPNENMFLYLENITLVVVKGSKAEEYAQNNDLKYVIQEADR